MITYDIDNALRIMKDLENDVATDETLKVLQDAAKTPRRARDFKSLRNVLKIIESFNNTSDVYVNKGGESIVPQLCFRSTAETAMGVQRASSRRIFAGLPGQWVIGPRIDDALASGK